MRVFYTLTCRGKYSSSCHSPSLSMRNVNNLGFPRLPLARPRCVTAPLYHKPSEISHAVSQLNVYHCMLINNMRTLLLPLLAALTSVIASEALSPSVDETPLDISNVITGDSHSLVKRAPVPASDVLWQSYICRGQKLQLLDTLDPQNAQQFGTPLNSPWTGTLVNELALWGYDDNSNVQDIKDQCDFSMRPIFESTLKAMGISAKSESDGGPNKCFYYVHKNGPAIERQPNGQLPPVAFQYYTVNGRRYRVTAAHHVIGINAQDGVIHFINRVSAASSAKTLWGLGGRDQPPKDELPALASSSDIAWGLWERMSPGRLSNINYVFSHAVANGFTRAIVTRATEGRPLRTWPGEVFESGTEEYWALLGRFLTLTFSTLVTRC
jgi:hypothetical protein